MDSRMTAKVAFRALRYELFNSSSILEIELFYRLPQLLHPFQLNQRRHRQRGVSSNDICNLNCKSSNSPWERQVTMR
jgi:hypothetical protein